MEGQKNRRNIALPPTEHKIFRSTKNSETERGSTRNIIGSIREKNSTKKNDINLLVTKFFDSWTFLIYRSVPQRNFSARRQKIFDGKSWYSVLLHHFFRYLTFATFRNFRWFLKNFFGTVRQKNRRKTVICIKVFEIPKFWSLEVVPGNFCVLWDNKVRLKNVILRSQA